MGIRIVRAHVEDMLIGIRVVRIEVQRCGMNHTEFFEVRHLSGQCYDAVKMLRDHIDGDEELSDEGFEVLLDWLGTGVPPVEGSEDDDD